MKTHEERLIEAFILKEKQERYKTLLANSTKRNDILYRLNHMRDLDEKYVTWLPTNAPVEQMLRQHMCPESVYIVSCAVEIDCKTMPLSEALVQTYTHGWGTIISCISGQLAYFHDEAGARRAILQREPRVQ